jgi:two-component system response regulator YesN
VYNILIVDDEATVRHSIINNTNWNSLGFDCVGDCENGSEAIEEIDKFQPDVVLTDIAMPYVDGLQLTKYILEKYPRIKVIILTGYDDFDYAQQAVKLKAYDFILKPITADELRKLLVKLKENLDEEIRKLQNISKIEKQVKESMPLLKERFLNRLVSGHPNEGNIENKLEYFDIHFNTDKFLVFIVDVDDYGEFSTMQLSGVEDELVYYAVLNITEEIVSKYGSGTIFQNNNEKTIVILNDDNITDYKEKIIGMCEEIRQVIEKYLKLTVTIGVGRLCSGLNNISHSYNGAVTSLNYRFVQGKNHLINMYDIEGELNNNDKYNREYEKKIADAIKTGTVKETDEIISNIIAELKKSFSSIDKCYINIHRLIIFIIDQLNEIGIDETEIFGKEINPITEFYSLKTLGEFEQWFKIFCKKANRIITDKRDNYSRRQALKAEEYIKQNFMDENISLDSVCKHLLMSPSYFSAVFKSYTGETFIEYLTRVRMQQARVLLKTTDLKTYEVASKVGYSDPHYFGMIFKKTMGMTPTEFRNRV